jgi:hypothetical protein
VIGEQFAAPTAASKGPSATVVLISQALRAHHISDDCHTTHGFRWRPGVPKCRDSQVETLAKQALSNAPPARMS